MFFQEVFNVDKILNNRGKQNQINVKQKIDIWLQDYKKEKLRKTEKSSTISEMEDNEHEAAVR